MGKLGVVLGLSLLAACAPADTWSSRVEDPGLPPFLPEHLLRKPADFRLYDAPVRKEFFLYFYADEEVQEDIVAVIDYAAPEGQRRPRFATREEHAYALDIFQADWRSRGDEAKLKYFNERHAIDTRRKESLIDQKIDFKKREIQHLADKAYDIESDLASRKDTNTFGPGNEKLTLSKEGALAPAPALEAELARTRRKLAVAETQLFVLEYRRSLRDLADARGSGDYVEGRVGVADLLPDDSKNEEFINQVVRKVSPAAWQRPEARIGISRGDLVVIQTRDVIVQVRDYVNQLRHEARAKLQSSSK
jgi:hypothetical protein